MSVCHSACYCCGQLECKPPREIWGGKNNLCLSYHTQGAREPGELYINSHRSSIEGCFQWAEEVLGTVMAAVGTWAGVSRRDTGRTPKCLLHLVFSSLKWDNDSLFRTGLLGGYVS